MAPQSAIRKGKYFVKKASGQRTSVQSISDATEGSRVYFNGQSPMVFMSVYPALCRVAIESGVSTLIFYPPGTEADDIVETDFEPPMPTEAVMVEAELAASTARANALQVANDALVNAVAGQPAAYVARRLLDNSIQLNRDLEAVALSRTGLMKSFQDALRHWELEQVFTSTS